MANCVTRFAPSPTGYLHIGGLRTALFAWAFARQNGGQFLLRIEDTDSNRSLPQHSQAIIDALQWVGINLDAPPIFQSANIRRHQEVIKKLLKQGHAYKCYATPEELDAMRQAQTQKGEKPQYDRRWRDNPAPPPANTPPCIRFKMPISGPTTFVDLVKGELTIDNRELDDFIIARSDGTPTYNFAATCDDVDMNISHIIRGDDHVMNTYRQWHLFRVLANDNNTPLPQFAHLPMILSRRNDNNDDGDNSDDNTVKYERMSKRNAAVDVDIYRASGILPNALLNYLARLSWSHGVAEVFNPAFLVEHFNFNAVSQSPARFDADKLNYLNREHLHQLDIDGLAKTVLQCLDKVQRDIARDHPTLTHSLPPINTPADLAKASQQLSTLPTANLPAPHQQQYINLLKIGRVQDANILNLIKPRLNQLFDIIEETDYFYETPAVDADLLAQYVDQNNKKAIIEVGQQLADLNDWTADSIKTCLKNTVKKHQLKFAQCGMPLRIMLTGLASSPDVAAVAFLLGQQKTLERFNLSVRIKLFTD